LYYYKYEILAGNKLPIYMYVVYYSTSLSPEITRPQKHSLYHLTY